jgi:hypothetical protein
VLRQWPNLYLHLLHMQVHAQLDFSTLPVLEGAYACLARGVVSSLHTQNARASASIQGFEQVRVECHAQFQLGESGTVSVSS